MDKVGLRELISAGVVACEKRYRTHIEPLSPDTVPARDAEIELILDRLAQTGITVLRHEIEDAWREVLTALLRILRLAIPKDHDHRTMAFPARNADFLLSVIERVLLLGGQANHLHRYPFAKLIVTQSPEERLEHYYWLRYAVTMAARGELTSFKGKKSLIPVASEYVRTRPEFYYLFGENMDATVNDMCQFDFVNCVIATHQANTVEACYPNFGLYWNHRTVPIVVDLVTNGPSRKAVAEITDERLAEILRALDDLAAQAFFGFSGWTRGFWGDERIVAFLKAHPPEAHPPAKTTS